MAGLNSLLSDTQQTTTTMPAWYDTAQQNIVNQGNIAAAAAPQLSQTVAQGAINQLQPGAANPFTQAQNTLQQISSGAANPWIVTPQYSQTPDFSSVRNNPNFQGSQDTFGGGENNGVLPVGEHALGMPDMGNGNRMNSNLPGMAGSLGGVASGQAQGQPTGYSIAPNPYTAMGGLFAAERDQLNEMMPQITAPSGAAGIGSGNFGSLRGQTAVNYAKGDAFSKLMAQQMQAALSNQQTGQAAAANLGNVANQGINAAMNVGTAQQNAPFQTPGNLASLLGTLQAPTTVSSQKQLSPLGQISTIGNAVQGGLGSLTALANTPAGKSLLNSLNLGSLFGTGSSTGTPALQYGTDQATQDLINSGATARDDEGNLMPGWGANADGSYSWTGNTDSGGTDYTDPTGDMPDWSASESYD